MTDDTDVDPEYHEGFEAGLLVGLIAGATLAAVIIKVFF